MAQQEKKAQTYFVTIFYSVCWHTQFGTRATSCYWIIEIFRHTYLRKKKGVDTGDIGFSIQNKFKLSQLSQNKKNVQHFIMPLHKAGMDMFVDELTHWADLVSKS